MADEELDIILEAKAEGEHQIRDMKDAFDDLRRSVLEATAAIVAAMPAQEAATAATVAASKATKEWTQSMGDWSGQILKTIPYIGDFLAGAADIPVVGPFIVTAILGVVAVLAILANSLIIVTAAGTTFVTAAVLGFTAVATAATLAWGAIGLLGAGVAILGIMAAGSDDVAKATKDLQAAQDAYNVTQGITLTHAQEVARAQEKLKEAQDAYNAAVAAANTPFGQFKKGLEDLKETLGKEALPLLQQMAGFGNTLLPIVGKLGSELISWFGDRLPVVLGIVNSAIGPVVGGFRELGGVLDTFIQATIARSPLIGSMLQQTMHAGNDAVKGLLDNLLKFVDWFGKEWPTLEPVAREVMSRVGQWIQDLGREAGKLVDWFKANWPEIKHTIDDLMPVLSKVGPTIEFIGLAMFGVMRFTDTFIGVMGWVRDRLAEAAGAAERLLIALDALMSHGSINVNVRQTVTTVGGGGGGGEGFSAQSGGIVPGPVGQPRLILAHGGERVSPYSGREESSGGYNITMHIYGGSSQEVAAEVDRRLSRLLTAT